MYDERHPGPGAFLPASLMYFCSGQPMHFCCGVDNALGTSRILEGLNPRRGLVARRMGIGCRAGRRLGTVLASRIGFPQLGQCGTLGLGRGASMRA